LFGLSLVLLALVLVVWHLRAWHAIDQGRLDEEEVRFFRTQLIRRATTGALLGALGVTIAVVPWVKSPLLFTVFFLFWMFLLFCILVMAVWDMTSNRVFLREIAVKQRVRRAELEAEIERLRDEQRTGEENGKSSK
jgi:hypothetical protein